MTDKPSATSEATAQVTSSVTYADVEAAARRLTAVAHRTPVLTSRTINQLTNAQVFLKCENFQRTGSFKFRGAYNALAQLSEQQKQKGVLTFSSSESWTSDRTIRTTASYSHHSCDAKGCPRG